MIVCGATGVLFFCASVLNSVMVNNRLKFEVRILRRASRLRHLQKLVEIIYKTNFTSMGYGIDRSKFAPDQIG